MREGEPASEHPPSEGLWRRWRADGSLQIESEWRSGRCIEERVFDRGNTLSSRKLFDAKGRPTLWTRLDRLDEVPERRPSIPADAIYDFETSMWLVADGLEAGASRRGVWQWWFAEEGVKYREEHYEAGGDRVLERIFVPPAGRLFSERSFVADQPVLERHLDEHGAEEHHIDRSFEGSRLVTEVLTKASVVRIRHAAAPVDPATPSLVDHGYAHGAVELFDEGGAPLARGEVRRGHAHGTWSFWDQGERLEVEMPTDEPMMTMVKIDGDFDPRALIGRVLFDRFTPSLPAPAGVDAVDWAQIDVVLGDTAVAEVPRLISALTAPTSALRDIALTLLAELTTTPIALLVEEATVVVPAVVRCLVHVFEHPRADRTALLRYLADLVWKVGVVARPGDPIALEIASVLRESLPELRQHTHGVLERRRLTHLAGLLGAAGNAILIDESNDADEIHRAEALHGLLCQPDQVAIHAGRALVDPSPLVRLVASLAIATSVGPAAPQGVERELLDNLDAPPDLAAAYDQLFLRSRPLVLDLAFCLARLRSRTPGAAARLAAHLPSLGWQEASALVRSLFQLCFDDGEPPFAPGFVDVLESIGRSTQFGERLQEQALYDGLPVEVSAYPILVADLRASTDPACLLADRIAHARVQAIHV